LRAQNLRPRNIYSKMTEINSEEDKNKTPSRMARLTWPKAKYGLVLAVIIIIIVNLVYYKEVVFSLFR
jgi:hypothetical protein